MRNYWIFPPAQITIETTTKCPANCIMCPRSSLIRRRKHMPTSDVYHILDQINWDCVTQWSWINEPLCDERLEEFVKASTRKGLRSLVNTNGYLLTEEIAVGLFRAGLTTINFSIDSVFDKTYKQIRLGLELRTVLENLNLIVSLKKKHNFPTEIWVSRVRLKGINDSWQENRKFHKYFDGLVNHVQTTHYCRKGSDLDKKYVKLPVLQQNYCWFIENDMTISVDGDVPLCCCFVNSIKYSTGNVFEGSLLNVWNSPLRHKIAMGIRRFGMNWFEGCVKVC